MRKVPWAFRVRWTWRQTRRVEFRWRAPRNVHGPIPWTLRRARPPKRRPRIVWWCDGTRGGLRVIPSTGLLQKNISDFLQKWKVQIYLMMVWQTHLWWELEKMPLDCFQRPACRSGWGWRWTRRYSAATRRTVLPGNASRAALPRPSRLPWWRRTVTPHASRCLDASPMAETWRVAVWPWQELCNQRKKLPVKFHLNHQKPTKKTNESQNAEIKIHTLFPIINFSIIFLPFFSIIFSTIFSIIFFDHSSTIFSILFLYHFFFIIFIIEISKRHSCHYTPLKTGKKTEILHLSCPWLGKLMWNPANSGHWTWKREGGGNTDEKWKMSLDKRIFLRKKQRLAQIETLFLKCDFHLMKKMLWKVFLWQFYL